MAVRIPGASDDLWLFWEGRSEPGKPWGHAGFRPDHGGIGAQLLGVGTASVVFGHAPSEATTVRFVGAAGSVDLEADVVVGARRLFAGEVSATSGYVAALDAHGRELARSRPLSV